MGCRLSQGLGGGLHLFFSHGGDDDGSQAGDCLTLSLIGKFELILSEWHLSPEYILEHWSDEQFDRFWDARNERFRQTSAVIDEQRNQAEPSTAGQGNQTIMSKLRNDTKNANDQEFFASMGIGLQKAGRA